jgi:hypothetical protein
MNSNTKPLNNRHDKAGMVCPNEAVTPNTGDAIVAHATPSSLRAGGIVPRRRHQKGRLVIRGVREPQRCGLYREDVLQHDGTIRRVRRTIRLGPVSRLSERAAWAKFQPYLNGVNSTVQAPIKSGMTLEAFAVEWRSAVAVNLKASTARAAESHLRAHILPKLGKLLLTEVTTKALQAFVTYVALSGVSRKTIENILLTLSSLLRTTKSWGYASCGFSLSDLTLPRNGIRKEQRCFSAEEIGRIIFAAPEPFATIWALTAILGLRVGEVLALRVSDLDFDQKLIRVRQSLDSATRRVQACKSNASSADLPMPPQLELRLVRHLSTLGAESDLLFSIKIRDRTPLTSYGKNFCIRCFEA